MEKIGITTPDGYIRTTRGSALAIIKLLEGLLMLGLTALMLMNWQAVNQWISAMTDVISSQAFHGIQGFVAAYMLLEACGSLAVFTLRFWRRGAWVIQMNHWVKFAVFLTVLFGGGLLFILSTLGILNDTQNMDERGSLYTLFRLNFFLYGWLYVLIAAGALVVNCDYHQCVARVMKQIQAELDENRILLLRKKSRLTAECRWIVLITAITLILTLLGMLSAGPAAFTGEYAGYETLDGLRPLLAYVNNPNLTALLSQIYLLVRFWLILSCSKTFDWYHK